VPPEVVPAEYRAEGLLERLAPLVRAGDAVLLPRAERTRDLLVRGLTEQGATVAEVPAYRTRAAIADAARVRTALARGEVDVVTFTSPSTARNFASLFGEDERRRWLATVVVACIGPVTAETAATCGLVTRIMPVEYTIPALARAIGEYFAQGPGGR
jgi:uroporphyrinogen III methyltransferase/synthase